MNNAIFTVNMNNHLCQNSRDSYLDAARRWDAELVEITEAEYQPPFPPQFTKLKAFELCDADRIFCIDADCIIRIDTPSPFELYPPEVFCAVVNKQPHMGGYIEAGRLEELAEFRRIHEAGFPDLNFNFDLFINSGMWVGSRKEHEEVVCRALRVGLGTGTLHWWDQAALNYALAENKTKLVLLDYTWNYCLPNFPPWKVMMKYIYHFAGMPSRYEILPTVNWRNIG